MENVISKDGTPIAFDRTGSGPALILVDGAMCSRGFGPLPAMARRLSTDFTVFHYDRRGRGDSGNHPAYSVEREIDDLDAILQAAGGSAFVFGVSSGAALAVEAAATLRGIRKLALYEAPFVVDNTHPPLPPAFIAEMKALVAADERGAAVKKFMRLVGVPSIAIVGMSLMRFWKKLKAIAHTLANDLTIIEPYHQGMPLPRDRWSRATMPSLVMAGGKSPAYMQNGMRELATVLPNAQHLTLPGQTHMVKAPVVAPELVEFFGLAAPAAPATELSLSR